MLNGVNSAVYFSAPVTLVVACWILPGVLMCEAGAQLCSYYVMSLKLLECDFMAFGGMENVRFRGTVPLQDAQQRLVPQATPMPAGATSRLR